MIKSSSLALPVAGIEAARIANSRAACLNCFASPVEARQFVTSPLVEAIALGLARTHCVSELPRVLLGARAAVLALRGGSDDGLQAPVVSQPLGP